MYCVRMYARKVKCDCIVFGLRYERTLVGPNCPHFSPNSVTISSYHPLCNSSNHVASSPTPTDRMSVEVMPSIFLDHWGSDSYLLVAFTCRHVKLIAHDQPKLSNQDHDEHNASKDRYKEDLEVQLHQSYPCRPIERLPRIKHGHGTAATQDLRFDFTSEGTVERDNGLVLLWQHGSLDTLEGDIGWDDDENEDAKADETDEERLQYDDILCTANIFIHLFVESLDGKDEQGAWDVEDSLFSDCGNGGGNEDIPDGGPRWDTAVPGLVAWVRDDNVGPGHLKTAEGDACEDGDEGAGDRVADDVGAEEADDAAVEKVVDD